MEYTEYKYLWLPRPDNKIDIKLAGFYRQRGYVAQTKMNGSGSVVFVSPDKTVTAMSRHGTPHKAWQPTEESNRVFTKLPGRGWWVLATELMHSKVPGIRDTNYIHDVMVADGTYLVEVSFADRQKLLASLFPKVADRRTHYEIDDHTWLAKLQTGQFRQFFESLDRPELEGIVLKDANAPLELCSKPTANNGWQVKCRRSGKNLSF